MQYQTIREPESFVEATRKPSTLIELLDHRALQHPDQLAYTFLVDGETSELHLTYRELQRRARAIAAALAGMKGERALLLYPPGLDFVEGFFGCLYAGVVAVPAYPPHFAKLNRNLPRLRAIIADAQAEFVLTTSSILERAQSIFTDLHWLATDVEMSGGDEFAPATSSDLAFLQYTSGSTGNPRGVMLTHANLLHNASLIAQIFEHTETDSYVSWLPMFHDMGLMVGVLQPLYAGIRAVVMSPVSFLQRPARWLEAISRYRATTSGGPNFAYDLCARKVTADDISRLDLSSWTVAFNGAEPVRAETLERFATRFASCGFRRAAFFPCYGLAEATLVVTGGRKHSLPVIKDKLMVGCGGALRDERVIIVDPETLTELEDGVVGEIWVSGPSVARGYWNRSQETHDTFNAYLSDTGEGPFLRTEDLGVIEHGELYVTGRIKDLIIIRGLNHYPQDIEWTVERCHPALRPGCGAAFTVDAGDEEQLVIVQEVDPHADLDQVIETIREAVAAEHELQVYAVALIKPGRISKTSSGKIQRRASRTKFLEGTLDAVAEWRAAVLEDTDAPESLLSANSWLASHVAARLGVVPRMDQPLVRYGLDSLAAIELAHSIETSLGVTLPMVSFLQGLSIDQLAAQINSQLSERSKPAPSAGETEYPLSYGQQGLWFLHNLAPESTAYNLARAVKIRAALDVAALRRAFSALVARHAVLRTTFATSRGYPIQRVAARVEPHFQQEDARHWSEAQLEERLTVESERPFDLARGPLLRVNLFTRSNDEHVLLLAAHHIIIDFWSLALLIQELGVLYESDQAGLPPLSSSYSAFVSWQRELLSSEEGERHWQYWQRQLSRELPILNLPTTFPRPPVQTFRGASEPLRLSTATVRGLKALSREHSTTLYVTLLAAFQALLHRYTGQEDLLVGSVTAGRTKAEFAPLIGYFVNPLVLRAMVLGNDSFDSLLEQARRSVLDAFEHQDYPFSILVERLQAARDPSRAPLFQVMFSMHKAQVASDEGLSLFALGEAGARMSLGSLEMESMPLKRRVAQFDLTLMMAEAGEELYATFEYNTDLFDAATIKQLAQSFRILLDAVVANPAERISRLPLLREDLSRKDAKTQRKPFRNAAALGALAPLREKTIHQLFEAQADSTPESIAVVFGEQRLTYRELNERANRVARHLRKLGVGPESRVGICLERSTEMLVGLLGILKAGGAYVPIDTSYPPERVAFLLEDARVEVLVTHSNLLSEVPTRVVCLDKDVEGESGENFDSTVSPDNAAYIIYTSGSTGRPKGVVVSHHNVLRLFAATKSSFDFSSRDVWTLFHSYAFDFSVWELWGALLHGGRVVVVPYFVSRTPEAFRVLLREEGVTVLNQTPSAFRQLMFAEESAERLTALRLVIFGGEVLELQSLRPWLQRYGDEQPQLVNMYGITETTVHVTCRRIRLADLESGRGSVIGAALPDLRVYVLDQHQQPVPSGVAGELCVAGDGLARGYLHQPQLTAEQFLPDPFGSEPGARLYRSGDLGRRLRDGEIEYLGRIDQQVKIRGFRVEPGEIEATLNEHPAVRESVVIARSEANGDKRLVAYVVAEDFSADELRTYLGQRLPEYMVPAAIVQMDSLPLTLNGKIDRHALPAPDGVAIRTKTFEAPRTDTEQLLATIWSEVLGVKPVGVTDNFFELGGDSILSIQIIARAKEVGIQLTPKQLFQHQTIAALAQLTGTLPETSESPEDPGPARYTYPLTPMQQGILFHSLSEPDSGVYTTQFVCELIGELDQAAFEAAWQTVVQRHQSLRADFAWDVWAEPVQVVRRSVEVKLHGEDWTAIAGHPLEEYLQHDRERGFDFKRAPLMRLALFKRSHEEYVFVFSHHHLLLDGWSLAIVLQEVFAVYDGKQGLKESRPFSDYVAWLGQQDQVAAESFWRKTLKGFTEPTALGIENTHAEQGYSEASLYLSETLTESLQAFARRHQLTLSTVLYGAWSILLSRYSGERDIVFGVTSSGRPPELSGSETMVGLFINTLPLRVNVPACQPLVPWLQELQEQLVELRQYEYSALAQVQEWSDVPRGRALFESIFVFENYPVDSSLAERDFSRKGAKTQTKPSGNAAALCAFAPLREKYFLEITNARSIEQTNYPLTIAADPGARLALVAGYKTDRFDAASISRMLGHLEILLAGMIASQRLSDLSLLNAAEREMVLREWNETHVEFPSLTLHELFERQAAKTPDAVALIFEDERLSYRELNGRADALAHYLRGLGLKRVGICLERGIDMIICLLGILKAGAAYMPLDPEYPRERLAYMLANAQPELVLTSYPQITQIKSVPSAESVDDLAYVIYTSGSTGQPKGVMVSHRAVSNHMQWIAREFPLDQSDRMLFKYSISFDPAIEEIFHPLISGASLVIVPSDRQYDTRYLVDVIREQQVTAIDVVPTMLKALLDDERIKECRSLRRVLSGGEVLSVELKDRVYARLPEVELVNVYGPTEAAITTTYHRCEADERTVSIGKPVANARVYVLDQNLEPAPVGVPGELHIGGTVLAWGYLNQPSLTAEKFIPDPFTGEVGARLYKSGDWGRYSANGDLEYLGRFDGQVKLRGFRIELSEIEARLRNHTAVKDAAVIMRDKRLIAYVVADSEADELRAYLKGELPEYMLPSAVVLLDALPLSGSGKVDVRLLPVPEEKAAYVEPRTPVEQELAGIWQAVLGVERVGVTDNFFELGGDSIVSIQIVARARDAGLLITPKQVLSHASILELANVTTVSREPVAEEDLDGGAIPLTPIQHWFFEQQLPDPHHYNQAVMLELKQPVSADLLRQTLGHLIEHHDALRLRFDRETQTIATRETQQFFRYVDLSSSEAQTTDIAKAADEAQASLSLSDGPIIRAVYFDLGVAIPHRLLIVIHHLAVDGVSWRILLDDLQRTYEQLQRGKDVKLPARTLSFKRWSDLLSAHAQTAAVREELEYWTAEARGHVGKLPVDRAGENRANSARSVSVSLTAEETRLLLQEVPRAYQTQINDVLLAALAQTISEWTGQSRVLVDLEGHGREEIVAGCDLSRTVGWFTTIFPVLLEVSNSSAPGETLKSVKEQLRRVPNRGIGYGLLRYLRGDSTQLQELPPAQVSFNYLGQLDQIFSDGAFSLTNDPVGQSRGQLGKRNYLIEIDGAVRDGRLELEWVYSNELHTSRTIEAVAGSFIRKLRRLIEHCVLREVREYTPSDFPLAHLNERQLAQIQKTAGPIEDLYPLSPMQEGMLFHSLYGSDSGIYTTQLVCELKGRLNEDVFEKAWQAAVDAHAVLRTGFAWEGVEEPLQVVRRSVKVRFKREDWRSLDRRELEENYLRSEREQEFDLKQSPLMRLALVRTADDESLFIWTSHHLLLDGWSLPVVLRDVLTAYHRLRRGEPASLKPQRSYRDYITWIKKQDLRAAESFWRHLLKGFKSPTPLPNHQLPATGDAEDQIQLSRSATAQLQRFAHQHQLTLNTVVQGAWALLLSSLSGREDVVFGVVVSGRSAPVAEVESIVGLFINTLPARATITVDAELSVWLRQLQSQQSDISQYEYSPLARVQAWSEVEPGQPLFESIFVFENYPVGNVTNDELRVGSVRSIERSNYPLTVWAIPERELVLRIGYDKRRFHKEWIGQLLQDYQALLEQISEALWVKDLLPKKHKTHKSRY